MLSSLTAALLAALISLGGPIRHVDGTDDLGMQDPPGAVRQ